MDYPYSVKILSAAKEYIDGLTDSEQGIIAADIDLMRRGKIGVVHTKPLRKAVRELISGHHRITYFRIGTSLHFVRGFRKKTGKTPKSEIDYAEKIYKIVRS